MVTEQCNQPSLRVEVGPGTLVWRGLTDQFMKPEVVKVFPYSSVGKESTCNAGDPSSIPKSGRSLGEGIGYPLQYSWASLVVQLVKNLSAMRETWVQSLGWEDPLEKGKATHSSILAWRVPQTVQSMGLDTTERLSLSYTLGENLNVMAALEKSVSQNGKLRVTI